MRLPIRLPLRLPLRLPALLIVAFVGTLLRPLPLHAQVRPDLDWRTLRTDHFRVHFAGELEPLARRTAAHAEWAYGELAKELRPPRGIVDIVLADNVDFANGYATPFPTNRIVIYARPPVEEMSLRNHVDWNQILVTHELAHIFHLDRARGWWWLAQRVFGRAAPTFPNLYSPAWVLEGLAVHYETRLTGAGRLAGTEFPMLARAAALGDALPSIDEISLASPRFPGGNVAYIHGAYLMTLADSGSLGRFVERESGRIYPWRHEASAREAFGRSFSDYWETWRDSVTRAGAGIDAVTGVQTLTTHKFTARFPRFTGNDVLVYVANDNRSTTGLYRINADVAGDRQRLGRRNSLDVNSPLDARTTIQGELEYSDPYTVRSDLYRDGRALLFGRRRLTRDARLSSPDVHPPSGRIVAVQTIPGTTQLVTLDARQEYVPIVIARGTLDRTWSEPRWSHDGTRIAAARWETGGRTSIVVMDTGGGVMQTFSPRGPRLTIVSSPVWVPGDTTLLFVSDHEGRAMIYRGDVRTGGYARVWASATGLNTPDVSPDGRRMAAVEARADGYRVVTKTMPGAVPLIAPAADSAVVADIVADIVADTGADTGAAASDYSGWQFMKPSWWLPLIAQTDPGTLRYGVLTGARDVVGRHEYRASLELEPQRKELSADVAYSWAGLGNPVITGALSQYWQHGQVLDSAGAQVGLLGQITRTASLTAFLQRPRARRSSYVIAGGAVEQYHFRTYPASLLGGINNDAYRRVITTQSAIAEVGFSTMQRPGLAVSVEDGVALSVTHRARFGSGIQFEDVQETIVAASAAKSLPLPGFAHHVVALRGAYGVTGHLTTSAFSVGGVSGASLEVLPGLAIGGQRRTFFVRGFEGGTQYGVRAAAASAEYRAPLALLGRGIPFLPLFFQKTMLTVFADGGAAWCSFPVRDSFICPPSTTGDQHWMASAGGELSLDAALQYDVLYRFRFGVAHAIEGQALAPRPTPPRPTTFYFSLGSTF